MAWGRWGRGLFDKRLATGDISIGPHCNVAVGEPGTDSQRFQLSHGKVEK